MTTVLTKRTRVETAEEYDSASCFTAAVLETCKTRRPQLLHETLSGTMNKEGPSVQLSLSLLPLPSPSADKGAALCPPHTHTERHHSSSHAQTYKPTAPLNNECEHGPTRTVNTHVHACQTPHKASAVELGQHKDF